ncbi:hypothetical protein FKW77_008339 [Venturia effusa]|uniref:Ubiquitin-like domain-containing protein n=1 Tax=Venturia effusa TaxID=50376 RepID=A0A517LEA2_9PEZI|nr:hypothetical protein FKW77_008339 [Venturia effusa]
MSGSPPEELLWLVIRFTTALPDLPLTISSPLTTPTIALKALIRPHLPSDAASNRLRLIYGGKVLEDATPLHQALLLKNRHPPPPPPKSSIAKGKQPIRDDSGKKFDQDTRDKIYIHCSIGDVLAPEDVEQEATRAAEIQQRLEERYQGSSTHSRRESTNSNSSLLPRAGPIEPRGFDRLLSTGFTQADVASLRTTFLHHLSLTHTPDTMPHGRALLALEERWLESSGPDAVGGDGFDDEESTSLDDMLWGNIIGFFWPLGALVWGVREDGVWTRRRMLSVATGVLVNFVFGFARLSSVRS